MKVSIDRSEPTTGGPSRTPRDRIEPVFSETDEVEPDAAIERVIVAGLGWQFGAHARRTNHMDGADGVAAAVHRRG